MNNLQNIEVVIIVPVFNAEPYLERCLDSLVKQKGPRICVLIVNDGSTDASQIIIDEYVQRHPSVFISFSTPNRGTGPARNFALSKILEHTPFGDTGTAFVSFVDADDWLEEGAIELLHAEAKRHERDIVFSDHFFHRESEKNLVTGFWGATLEDPEQRLCCSNVSTVWAKLIKLSLFKDLRFPALVHEDAAITPILFRNAHAIGYLPMPLYNYYFRSESKTGSGDFHLKPDILLAIEMLLNHARSSDDVGLLQFAFEYYLSILVEYKNRCIADYDRFEKLNEKFLSGLGSEMILIFQNCAVRRIQNLIETKV